MMLTHALAETTELAAEQTAAEGISLAELFFIALGAYFIFFGAGSIVKKKVLGNGKSMARYTEESKAKFSRNYGIAMLLLGVADLTYCFLPSGNIVGIIILVIAVAVLVLGAPILQEKEEEKKETPDVPLE